MRNFKMTLFLILSIIVISSCNKEDDLTNQLENTNEISDTNLFVDHGEIVNYILSQENNGKDFVSSRATYNLLYERDLILAGPNLGQFRGWYFGDRSELEDGCKAVCYVKYYDINPIHLKTSGMTSTSARTLSNQIGPENPKISFVEKQDLKDYETQYRFMVYSNPYKATGKMLVYQICQ